MSCNDASVEYRNTEHVLGFKPPEQEGINAYDIKSGLSYSN
jgi:hypothetical protein